MFVNLCGNLISSTNHVGGEMVL